MALRQPIIWCCPVCQRSFDVGCCPEHTLENGAFLMPYTAPDKEMARQPSPAPRPDHKRSESRGRTPE